MLGSLSHNTDMSFYSLRSSYFKSNLQFFFYKYRTFLVKFMSKYFLIFSLFSVLNVILSSIIHSVSVYSYMYMCVCVYTHKNESIYIHTYEYYWYLCPHFIILYFIILLIAVFFHGFFWIFRLWWHHLLINSFTSSFPIHIPVIAFSCLIAFVSICNIILNGMDTLGTFVLNFRGKRLQH